MPGQDDSLPADGDEVVSIDYGEEVDLEALTAYVSTTLGLTIIYADELQAQRVTVRPSSIQLPKRRLLEFLTSMLRVKGLALVHEDATGIWRIVKVDALPRHAQEFRTGAPAEPAEVSRVITQVIQVGVNKIKNAADTVRPFLTSAKSSLIVVEDRGLLVITDYESTIARVMRLIELIGAQPIATEMNIVLVEHRDAVELAADLDQLLLETNKAASQKGKPVSVIGDLIEGKIILVGTAEEVRQAALLLEKLDVATEDSAIMRSYAPQHAAISRIRQLIENVILKGQDAGPSPVFMHSDPEVNRLYVRAPVQVHEQVAALLAREDVGVPESARPIRIYRPRHRSAKELIVVLAQLLEATESTKVESADELMLRDETRLPLPGRNRPPAKPGVVQIPPMPPAQVSHDEGEAESQTFHRIEGRDFVLTVDEHTNSIIAAGPRAFHEQLRQLLDQVDQRRPQVLIEMTLVAATLSDSLALGVELESLDLGDGIDYLLFSSFNLSSIDPVSGQRALSPGLGANGILLTPNQVPIVIKALATHGDVRVLSTPRILVADNAQGVLRNVDEAPFTSVNASDTVATTSFAGFESAGTTLMVRPHVSEGDHLLLEYDLTFSSFSGPASDATAPPPRTTNSFNSTVEVPDGYTVVIGGLTVENDSDSISEVPFLGRIPGLGLLFQSNTRARTRTKIYAFIRPVILRDDQFEHLKFISARDLDAAELTNPDFPESQLQWMR